LQIPQSGGLGSSKVEGREGAAVEGVRMVVGAMGGTEER